MTTETEMDALWGEEELPQKKPAFGEWFARDRYSMFIHWGLYSHIGGQWKGKNVYGIGEWIMNHRMAGIPVDEYKALANEFDPAGFDAKAIVQLAKKAGMRCIVYTAKHHEGFAMYDSGVSDFSITKASPFGRDPFAELSEACKEEGIRLGFYYSQNFDWTEPDGGGSHCVREDGSEPDFDRYFERKAFPQVRELLSNYGEISVVWFDTPGRMPALYSQRLVDLVHELQPGCLVNSRVGNGLGDYATLGDMELPTRTARGGLFECVDTTNDSWSYSAMDSKWKSPTNIVRNLVCTISRNSSYMLNIGPDGNGVVPAPAVEALEKSGEWIHAHEEALVGVGPSPFPPYGWGDCTVKEHILYVHVFDLPEQNVLRLGRLESKVLQADVPFTQEEGIVSLDLSGVNTGEIATVVQLECDTPPRAMHEEFCLDGFGSVTLPAEYAKVDGCSLQTARWMEEFGAWKKAEHVEGWNSNASTATWQVDVLETAPFSVMLEYACDEANEGSEWCLEAGEEQIIFCAMPTGQNPDVRRMRYRSVLCGRLLFSRTGLQPLTFSPLTAEAGTIALKSISLIPWK